MEIKTRMSIKSNLFPPYPNEENEIRAKETIELVYNIIHSSFNSDPSIQFVE